MNVYLHGYNGIGFSVIILALVLVPAFVLPCAARSNLATDAEHRWVVLASRRDPDAAIGVATVYRWRFEQVRIVRSSNDWLAVIAGPVAIPEGVKAAKTQLLAQGGVPHDIFFSNGVEFETTVWQATTSVPRRQASASAPVSLAVNGTDIRIDAVPDAQGAYHPRIEGYRDGKVVFSSVLDEAATQDGRSEIAVVPLDPALSVDQIVLSAFWEGAHCCTVTKIFTVAGDEWSGVAGDTLDGGGYWFDDLDGDGSFELLSTDNSFLYAFAPYAMSWAPIRIQQLHGSEIVDLRKNPGFERFYRRQIFRFEHSAEIQPELWRSNGFLSAWVALKAVVGEFDDAWQRMMVSYDRGSDWPLKVCQDPGLARCPEEQQRSASFPEALQAHLQTTGYLPPEGVAGAPPLTREQARPTRIEESMPADD